MKRFVREPQGRSQVGTHRILLALGKKRKGRGEANRRGANSLEGINVMGAHVTPPPNQTEGPTSEGATIRQRMAEGGGSGDPPEWAGL